jgi:hypothetical protein
MSLANNADQEAILLHLFGLMKQAGTV